MDQTVLKVKNKFHSIISFGINCNKLNIKDINECEPYPCIHGSCKDGVNSYMCVCYSGYIGANCNESTNELNLLIHSVYSKLHQCQW